VRETIGIIQSEGIYPSIVGFIRPLLFTLLKVIIPLLFAAILVWLDIKWMTLVSVFVLFLAYFVLHFYFLKANTSTKELLNTGLFILAGYISIFLFILESHEEKNYIGWYYIGLLTIYASISGIG
jgi:hypothetical protein